MGETDEKEITYLYDRFKERGAFDVSFPSGWVPLLQSLNKILNRLDCDYRVLQIKDKFGGLRFYFKPSEHLDVDVKNAMGVLVRAAEAASYEVCSYCGGRGVFYQDPSGWGVIACGPCGTSRGFERVGND